MTNGQGKGFRGNPEEHAKAGRQSSGNPNPSKEAQRKGGRASHGGGRGRKSSQGE